MKLFSSPYMERLFPFFLCFIGSIIIFSLLFFYSSNPLELIRNKHNADGKRLSIKPQEDCDLFKGSWIPDPNASRYTNSSCATIPTSKNCFRHGREDRGFLNWRWKPEKCDLPRFDPKAFLKIVRGKTLAFVGDSVARNHLESLLCLLSQEEVPVDAYKDSENRNRVWLFPDHDFTLKILWTKFLLEGKERMINGSASSIFDLYLDRIDDNWTRELHGLDFVVMSVGHWFFRPMYLHNGSDIVACVYCNEPNVTDKGVNFAISMAFRAALNYINQCKKLKGIVTLLRTFSPSHFENGSWNTGGICNRTGPVSEREINYGSEEWGLRNMQVEEIEKTRKESKQDRNFDILDITRAMLMRPDAHPGAYWGNKWMKGFNDCVHWCMPGPIDIWNDLLLAVLRKRSD